MKEVIETKMFDAVIRAEVERPDHPAKVAELPAKVAEPAVAAKADLDAQLAALRAVGIAEDVIAALDKQLRPPPAPEILGEADWEDLRAVEGDPDWGATIAPIGSRWAIRDHGGADVVFVVIPYGMIPVGWTTTRGWSLPSRWPGWDNLGLRGRDSGPVLAPEGDVPADLLKRLYERYNEPGRGRDIVARLADRRRVRAEQERRQMQVPLPGEWRYEVAQKGNSHSSYYVTPGPGAKSQYLDSWEKEKPAAFKFHRALWSLFPSMAEWAGCCHPDEKIREEWRDNVRRQKKMMDTYNYCNELKCVMRCNRYNIEGAWKDIRRRRPMYHLVSKSGIPSTNIIRYAATRARNDMDRDTLKTYVARLVAYEYDDEAFEKLGKYIDLDWFLDNYIEPPKRVPIAAKDPVDLFMDELYSQPSVVAPEPDIIDESALPVNWRRVVAGRKAAATRKAKAKEMADEAAV